MLVRIVQCSWAIENATWLAMYLMSNEMRFERHHSEKTCSNSDARWLQPNAHVYSPCFNCTTMASTE